MLRGNPETNLEISLLMQIRDKIKFPNAVEFSLVMHRRDNKIPGAFDVIAVVCEAFGGTDPELAKV